MDNLPPPPAGEQQCDSVTAAVFSAPTAYHLLQGPAPWCRRGGEVEGEGEGIQMGRSQQPPPSCMMFILVMGKKGRGLMLL